MTPRARLALASLTVMLSFAAACADGLSDPAVSDETASSDESPASTSADESTDRTTNDEKPSEANDDMRTTDNDRSGHGDPETTIVFSDEIPDEERASLELVVPSKESTRAGTSLETPVDSPATFIAARTPAGTLRYLGMIPPGHDGDYEIGAESTASAVSFLPLTLSGFQPETQRAILDRLPNHPTFSELRDAIEANARQHPDRSPFGPDFPEVAQRANAVGSDLLDTPSKYRDELPWTRTNSQGLKIGGFCAGDRRLSCSPDKCRDGESGIRDLDKGLKYCVGDDKNELVFQNPKTVYYGVKTTSPDGSARDIALMQGKGGLLEGFAHGPPTSNIRGDACDEVTICQDFSKLDQIGSGDPCAVGASANTFKAFALGLSLVMTGSDLMPDSSKIKIFGQKLRDYMQLLSSPKGEAVIALLDLTAQALNEYDVSNDRIYIDIPGAGTAGPIDVDDLQSILQFVVDTARLLNVTRNTRTAERWDDVQDWKDALDNLIVTRPGDDTDGGLVEGMKGLALGLAEHAKSSAGDGLSELDKVDAATVTTVVGAVGTIGLIVELQDGDFDFDKYARLVSLAMEEIPGLLADLGIGLGSRAAETLAVSMLSISLGAQSGDLAWQVGDKAAPFVYDLTVGGFQKSTFTVPAKGGGTCTPSCEQKCARQGQSCGWVPGCPSGACGSCSGDAVCSSNGSCVAPSRTCGDAQSRFKRKLTRNPEVGATDLLSEVDDASGLLPEESDAAEEFGDFSECVLTTCRDSSFPRSCYRDAVADGGPCAGICTDRAGPQTSCSPTTHQWTHSAGEDTDWPDNKNRVVSTPTDDGVCAAFLDHSGALQFTHHGPDGETTTHMETISGDSPAEVFEMAWSGTNCALIYRRKVDITPNDELYLARWNPDAPREYAQTKLTKNTYNSSKDAGFTGLDFIPGQGWVAGYVETSVARDNLRVGLVPDSFGDGETVRREKVDDLNVDPFGAWPTLDVGPAPGSEDDYAVAVGSRWGSQYQVRVYTGSGTATTHRPNLDMPYDSGGQFARLQLHSVGATSYLTYHDADTETLQLQEIRANGDSVAYGRTGRLPTGSRTGHPPTNVLTGGGRAGLWLLDPRDDEVYRVAPGKSGFQFVSQDHPGLDGADDLQTLYRDPASGRMYAFSVKNRDRYRSKLTGFCY